ncbi:MAG: argininosuccinate lyase [Clostridiales bacterium]|nr:argininosuccinate lyase [Candidatus Crickella merdequi]
MAKMWAGRTGGDTSPIADDFNSSIGVDKRMYAQDIQGSMAHAVMLAKQGIIEFQDAEKLLEGLEAILAELDSGQLDFDMTAEDIHMFVESELTKRLGDVGKKLHTARSRNDQVALDLRMYTMEEIDTIIAMLKELVQVLLEVAKANQDVIMPGYTHLQRAQPILFAHHMMAYAMMFLRDIDRLEDCRKRTNISPIGSCALAGTTYNTDREFEANALGFDGIAMNSIDGVSDRDYCIEFVSDASVLMMHLSRFSEELVLWSSSEFGFITLSDAFTTGSSIMPQKKNPDMAELCRGKTGRVYGDLVALLTILKGIPLAYNKDMQEEKEMVFDAIDTVKKCIEVYIPMIAEMKVNSDAMLNAVKTGYINATDLADYLVVKGLPFRDAYKISGKAVAMCIAMGEVLETLSLDNYKNLCSIIEEDVYDALDIRNCVERRISAGGTSIQSVLKQFAYVEEKLGIGAATSEEETEEEALAANAEEPVVLDADDLEPIAETTGSVDMAIDSDWDDGVWVELVGNPDYDEAAIAEE